MSKKPTQRRSKNHKHIRKLQPAPIDTAALTRLGQLAANVKYGGNPIHKKNPGNFNLTPPSDYDPNRKPKRSLCDEVGIFKAQEALALLRKGLQRGLVSVDERGGWPQNIWAVINGRPVEAALENQEQGIYHGYPIQLGDPFAAEILKRWENSNE